MTNGLCRRIADFILGEEDFPYYLRARKGRSPRLTWADAVCGLCGECPAGFLDRPCNHCRLGLGNPEDSPLPCL